MKKIKAIFLGLVLTGTLLSTQKSQAGSGNFIGSDGCLHVWTDHSFLGFHWGYDETVFCNSDGSPVQL